MKPKIALIQFWTEIRANPDYTKSKVEHFFKNAKQNSCDLICFPEDFWFGPLDYYSEQEIKVIIKVKTPLVIRWLREVALHYRLNVVAGSFIEEEDRRLFNIATVIDSAGEIICRYAKKNLVPYGFEGRRVVSGKNNPCCFMLKGVKAGLIICRDIMYPELIKNLRVQGVEMVFVPAFWPKRSSDFLRHDLSRVYTNLTEMKVVDVICQARSFESEIATLFVNASGKIAGRGEFDVLLGRTQVCIPFLGCIGKKALNREEILFYEYDRSLVMDARKAYQFQKTLDKS